MAKTVSQEVTLDFYKNPGKGGPGLPEIGRWLGQISGTGDASGSPFTMRHVFPIGLQDLYFSVDDFSFGASISSNLEGSVWVIEGRPGPGGGILYFYRRVFLHYDSDLGVSRPDADYLTHLGVGRYSCLRVSDSVPSGISMQLTNTNAMDYFGRGMGRLFLDRVP